MRNPFSAGSWVSGPNFFGRSDLIEEILTSNEKCDWIVAQRRMGKTSLLRKLEEQLNKSPQGDLGLFWDIQGAYDQDGFMESLEDAILDSQDLFGVCWEEVVELPTRSSSPHQVIKNLCRQLRAHNRRLVLLMDEAEEFISLTERTPETLSRLRKTFHSTPNLHTIICSTPRLEVLSSIPQIETSPFLHGFHARFLGNLKEFECVDLLKTGQIPETEARDIFELTSGNPFQTQLFAKYLFENRDFNETIRLLETNPSLAQVHEVNLGLLKQDESLFLFKVCNNSSFEPQNDDETRLAKKLEQLSYLHRPKDHWETASSFFAQWLKAFYSQKMENHPQAEEDVTLETASIPCIKDNLIRLYRFFLQHFEAGNQVNYRESSFKISSQDGKVYPVKGTYRLEPIPEQGTSKVHSTSWQNAAKETLELASRWLDGDSSWSWFRFKELVTKFPEGEESMLVDTLMLMREEAKLDLEG